MKPVRSRWIRIAVVGILSLLSSGVREAKETMISAEATVHAAITVD